MRVEGWGQKVEPWDQEIIEGAQGLHISHEVYGGFPQLGIPFGGGTKNKDYSILWPILGSSTQANYHILRNHYKGPNERLRPTLVNPEQTLNPEP